MNFLNHVDFNKSELRNAVVQNLTSAPASPKEGQIYYDTTSKQFYFYSSTSGWVLSATDSAKLGGNIPSYYLSRTNQTGTQLSSTISDLATTVKAYRLDEFTSPTANISLNSNRLINLADPINSQDAATRLWVLNQMDAAAAGIDSKASVRIVAVSNISLTGTQTIDGVTLSAGDRVLCTAQTTASQNGVYVVSTGAWARAVDADTTGEITPGAFWYCEEGSLYGKTQWRCSNTGVVTLGTTAITITQFGAANLYTASTGVQLVGTDFRIALATASGLTATSSGLAVDTTVVTRKYSTAIGDGSTTSIVVTHNLATQDVAITVRDASTGDVVYPNVTASTANTATISFLNAPTTSQYRVTIVG